jgi:hypothetical protein
MYIVMCTYACVCVYEDIRQLHNGTSNKRIILSAMRVMKVQTFQKSLWSWNTGHDFMEVACEVDKEGGTL